MAISVMHLSESAHASTKSTPSHEKNRVSIYYKDPSVPKSLHPKRHLDQLICFCRVHGRDQVPTQTEHATLRHL